MFTGIIRNLGRVVEIKRNNGIYVKIHCPKLVRKVRPGDSLAVDGVCLTVIGKNKKEIWFELIEQTWLLTAFRFLKKGSVVNLEKPLKLHDPLDGHLLMGHVDGLGEVRRIFNKKNLRQIEIAAPINLRKFIALRGAVGVSGVSLTVSHLMNDAFKVSLTKYTLENTNFGSLRVGDKINLEVDVISRYIDQLLKSGYESSNFVRRQRH